MQQLNPQQFYSLLYDMALSTSGETHVMPLLTKAMQRVMYHTGFPCGLFIRPLVQDGEQGDTVDAVIELSICHDDRLPSQGDKISLTRHYIDGAIELFEAKDFLGTGNTYHSALRIPVKSDGCFILLSPNEIARQLPYRQLFEPVMGNFSKNLQLCRENEANTESLKKEINEHKQTLASLRESEMNHKHAQRLGKMGHWILQYQSGELNWSDEIYRIFGRTPEEFQPSLENFYTTVHPQDLAGVKQAVQQAADIGSYKIEHRIVLPDESVRWVYEQARLNLDKDGQLIQMIGTVQDITEQKLAAEEKELLMRQLQQSQKMESIGHLTGGIAHDFNNILAAMLGFAELLQEMIPEDVGKDMLLGYVDEIVTGGERARDLVAQMLAFSRGQTGNAVNIDPIPVIREATRLVQAMIPSSIKIENELASMDELIHVDPVQLHQIIMNLVINARDAMDSKGTITVGLRNSATKGVCASCHEHFIGSYVELYVNDTGSGIESDILNRIFDPFYTSKDVGKGTGMGLSVVHGIVHESGGHIQVKTSPSNGTKISLLFPSIENHTSQTPVENMVSTGK